MALLYHYVEPQGYGGAKRLTPNNQQNSDNQNIANSSEFLINVVEDYPWTLSPKSVKKFVPYVQLTEYRQLMSSELISLIRNIQGNIENAQIAGITNVGEYVLGPLGVKAGAGALGSFLSNASQFLGTAGGARVGASIGGWAGAAANVLITGLGGALGQVAQTGTGIAGVVGANAVAYNALHDTFVNTSKMGPLKPYENLYSAVPTGFKYRLPYLSVDNLIEAGGKWGAVGKDGPVQATTESIKTLLTRGSRSSVDVARGGAKDTSEMFQEGYDIIDVIDKASKGLVGAAPGVAAETLKAFAPTSDGDTIKITFYLSNTFGDGTSIQRNWEFLYILTYQNLPNRRSINLLDPPCLYKVDIPGIKSFPVAAIESLKVTNEGTLRKVNITNGELASNTDNGKNIKAVPEVYKVTLTVRSLLTSTQNLFYYNDTGEEIINVITLSTSPLQNINLLNRKPGV